MLLRRLAGVLLLAIGVMAMLAPIALLTHAGYPALAHGRHASLAARAVALWPTALVWIALYLGLACAIGRMLRSGTEAQSDEAWAD